MAIWESADKLVKKEIMKSGIFSDKPTESSVCTIFVDEPQAPGMTIEQIKNEMHSEIIDTASRKTIVIGEACSTIDRYIERAIQMMSQNEQSYITVQVPNSEADRPVVSVVITLESTEFHKPIWEWTPDEKYDTVMKYKQKGVELFKSNRNVDAFHRFSKACKILITVEPIESDEPIFQKIIELKHILYNNLAQCQLIRGNYEHTITLCDKVLAKEENNVKALYRRAVAYCNDKNYEKALIDLKAVLTLDPKNKLAQEKYVMVSEQFQISLNGYNDLVRKMFKI